MRLKELSIRNLRLFGDNEQHITFSENKNVTILLGDNGAGKTTTLYACTVLLSQFLDQFPNIKKRELQFEDVRNISTEYKADFTHLRCVVLGHKNYDGFGNQIWFDVDIYKKGNVSNIPTSKLKQIKDYGLELKNRIVEGACIELPILAYYGTERGQITAPERRRDFSTVFPRWDSYVDSLESVTNFKRFFTWFERNEDLERREKIEKKDFEYTSHVLDAVRNALNRLFEGQYCNPRVLEHPLRFVMDDITDTNNIIEKRIERMSDGYRITIALVADIAARMAEANPSKDCSGLENPLDSSGIVLIDEIDLHLHPKLQRDIVGILTRIFPNVQFILSTYSPSVVLGSLDKAQIIKLDNGVITELCQDQFKSYDVSRVLLSELFGLDNVRTNEYMEKSHEYDILLSKHSMNAVERERFDELAEYLKRFTSYDVEEYRDTLSKIANS